MQSYEVNNAMIYMFLMLQASCVHRFIRNHHYFATLFILCHMMFLLRAHLPSLCGTLAWQEHPAINVTTIQPPDWCPTVDVQGWYMASRLYAWEDVLLTLPLYHMAWLFMVMHRTILLQHEPWRQHGLAVLKTGLGTVLSAILSLEAILLWEQNMEIARMLLLYAHLFLFVTLLLCVLYDVCYVAIALRQPYMALSHDEQEGVLPPPVAATSSEDDKKVAVVTASTPIDSATESKAVSVTLSKTPRVIVFLLQFNSNRGVILLLFLLIHLGVFLGEYQESPSNVSFVWIHYLKHLSTLLLLMSMSALRIYRDSLK